MAATLISDSQPLQDHVLHPRPHGREVISDAVILMGIRRRFVAVEKDFGPAMVGWQQFTRDVVQTLLKIIPRLEQGPHLVDEPGIVGARLHVIWLWAQVIGLVQGQDALQRRRGRVARGERVAEIEFGSAAC